MYNCNSILTFFFFFFLFKIKLFKILFTKKFGHQNKIFLIERNKIIPNILKKLKGNDLILNIYIH